MSSLAIRFGKRLGAALILLCMVAPPAAGLTSQSSQIEQRKAELRRKIQDAESRAKTITQQIAASDSRRAELERKIAALSRQLADATARLAAAEASLGIARVDLLSAEGSLAEALLSLDRLQSEHDRRARTLYMNGVGGYVELLLSARTLREFTAGIALVKHAMKEDHSRTQAVGHLTDQLSAARTEAAQHKTEIEKQKTDIEAERATIARLQRDLSRNRQQVVAELSARKSLLTKVQAEKADYLRQMQLLERESKSISSYLRSRQAGQVYRGATGLVWPTTGYISSGFGWRTHPIFGDRRFHTGIDIAAPAGQAILASLAGEVIFAGYRSGYGLTVIIDHGNSFATVYAHLSSAGVYAGQKVAKASRIGSIGCTGYCTGPHLHFETRVDGDPVDPMGYF